MDFLRTLFPGCGIIYNIRHPQEVVESEFQQGKDVEYFERFNTLLQERAAIRSPCLPGPLRRRDSRFRLTAGLYEFLGETFDRARVEAVLAVKHSYHSKSAGQVHSDVPRFVRVNRRLEGFAVFIVDRFLVEDEMVTVGGMMMAQRRGRRAARFARVLDERGGAVPFKAEFSLPSSRLGERLKSEAARKARFQISLARNVTPVEHQRISRQWLLAFTVCAEPPAAA